MTKPLKLALAVLTIGLLIIGLSSSDPAAAARPIRSSHIIVFKDTVDVTRAVPRVAKAYGLQVGFTYQYALKGMSAVVPDGRLHALQNDPRLEASQVQNPILLFRHSPQLRAGSPRLSSEARDIPKLWAQEV